MLAFSGGSRGLIKLAMNLHIDPFLLIIAMILIIIFLGMFMDSVAIVMIAVPIFFPLINAMGFNPVWFAIIFLINLEMAPTTPPYGMALFIMKGVAPKGTTMMDIYTAAIPFLLCDVAVMILMMIFPGLAVWLPESI